MAAEHDLGKGRIAPATLRTNKPRGFKKMACSECNREYYIRTGENRKVFKTCSTTCSMNRQSRLQKKNLALRRSEKKYIGMYFTKDEYATIKRFAKTTPVSRFIKSIVTTDINKRTTRAGDAGKVGKHS